MQLVMWLMVLDGFTLAKCRTIQAKLIFVCAHLEVIKEEIFPSLEIQKLFLEHLTKIICIRRGASGCVNGWITI